MEIFKYVLPIIIGVILDILVGSARNIPSFSDFVKLVFDKLQKLIKRDSFDIRTKPVQKSEKATELYFQGFSVTITTVIVTTIIPSLIVYFAYWVNSWVGVIVEGLACFSILGIKRIETDSLFVYDAVIDDDIPAARKELSFMTNRNVASLGEEGIIKNTVETIAEKSFATVLAPLFCMCFGCSWLAFLFLSIYLVYEKIGYKSSANRYYGKFVVNLYEAFAFLPSWVSGFVICIAANLVKLDSRFAFKIWKRDCKRLYEKSFSHVMAAMAGALDIQLGGNVRYAEESIKRPTIGDAHRPLVEDDIRNANKLMLCSMIIMLVLVCILRALLYIIL